MTKEKKKENKKRVKGKKRSIIRRSIIIHVIGLVTAAIRKSIVIHVIGLITAAIRKSIVIHVIGLVTAAKCVSSNGLRHIIEET